MKIRVIIFSTFVLTGILTTPPAAAEDSTQVYPPFGLSAIDTVTAVEQTEETSETEILTVRRPAGLDYNADGDDSRSGFTSKYITGKGRTEKRWKWSGGHWMGVGVYYGGLVKHIGHVSLPKGAEFMKQSAKSIGVNVQFIDAVLLSDRSFGLITGLGMEINNFRFDKPVGLTQDADGKIVENTYYNDHGIGLSKSKLTTVYLNLPLLAEFQFGRPKSNWERPGFVNFGPIVGLRINGHTKIKSSDPAIKGTFKQHEGLNLRNLHWGAEFNIGYKGVALSARYYPQSVFSKQKGPKVQQINLGLSLLF